MSATLNPVIGREFFGILRSPKAFGTLLAITIVFSLAVLLRWPTDNTADLSGQDSIQVFRVFGYGLLAGIVMLVPAFPATSIVNEKNSGTLALLLNSPLSGPAVYLGKFLGVLLFALLVLFASAPGAAACYAMGGIDLLGDLGLLYVVLILLTLQYIALGMLISSYVHSSDAGVRITYAIVFSLLFLTQAPGLLFPGSLSAFGGVIDVIRFASPLPIIMELMRQDSVANTGLISQSGILWFVAISLISTIAYATVTLSRLNYRLFDRSRSKGIITDDQSLGTRLARRLLFIVDPQRRKAGIAWFLNPVMVKEFRSRKFGRSQWLFRLIAVCAISSVVLTLAAATGVTAWGTETIGGLMVLLQVVLIVMLTPSLAAGLISGERDGGGWELLRLTPLSAFRIAWGKLLSVLWTLSMVLLATLPGYLVMIWIRSELLPQIQLVMVCLAWTVLYALAVSAAVGCLFRSTALSTAASYIAVMTLFLAPLLVWLGRDAPFGFDLVQNSLLINPVGAAMSIMETPGFAQYNLLPQAWIVAGAVSLSMFLLFGLKVWRLTRPV
ncbi:ABC-2 family transporter protein [Stieleria bergensis]|uniref:ABC-2 family transporter protein n=1 Tax=Stieleria bergensis TaxID=2528025 RepID=A0A517T1E6_9BACT|nr:ABC-2 family transporter protein [Planctomycetes bacterium SV_7m_r]